MVFKLTKTKIFIFSAVVILIALGISANSIWQTNDEGYFQVKQAFYTGEMTVRLQPGTYFQTFGEILTYKQVATVGFGEQKGEGTADIPAIPVIFNDGSKADISGLVRIQLPNNEADILSLKREFAGGYDHFIVAGIVPIVQNAVKLSANLRSAQDAYTTLALFQQAIEDQLRNGTYVTKSESQKIKRLSGEDETKQVTVIVTYPDSSKLTDKNGLPLAGQPRRIANRFTELGCKVNDCVISIPNFDPKVEEMISKRKDEAMKTELAKQSAIRSQQDALSAVEQGKANVATAKYEKEVELVRATTKAKEKFEVAQFAAKEAKELKKKKIALAEGIKQELLIADGLSARAKYQIDANVRQAIGVAEHMSKWKGPEIVVGAGNDGKSGGIETALMVEMYQKMVTNKTSK